MLTSRKKMETLNLISIQHELGMNIGLAPELNPMVRKFMAVCLRRLDVRRVHLCLLSGAVRNSFEEETPPKAGAIRISVPEGGTSPAICTQLEETTLQLLQKSRDETHIETIRQGDLFLHFYPVRDMGVVIFERVNSTLPPNLLQALIPIIQRFSAACESALQHEKIVGEVLRRKEAEKRIEHLAYHDDLTKLPNRRSLFMHLDDAMARTVESDAHGLLLYVDLDNFKDINDSLGYLIGDALIQQIGQRLCAPEYSHLFVARSGSDEFCILASINQKTENEARICAMALARRVQKTIAEPCVINEKTFIISASIGIVIFVGDGESADVLLGKSSHAMYQAKALGRETLHFFDLAMSEEAAAKLMLDAEMRSALQQDQFTLFLQPQVDETGSIRGAEALIRWIHPEKGMVPPSAFIPMAEKSGFIVSISDWVLKKACNYINRMEEQNLLPPSFFLAVNLSVKYFHQADFVERVVQIMDEAGTDPGRIELEITEGTLIKDVDRTIDKINRLRRMGLQFSIDDFGTGYSSMTYLKQLPIDRIKIDRSFVSNVDTSPDDAAIVETILSMAEHFQLNVIAEGVETKAELEFLTSQGCREFQGFYFYKPLEFTSFLHLFC